MCRLQLLRKSGSKRRNERGSKENNENDSDSDNDYENYSNDNKNNDFISLSNIKLA